MTREAKIGLLTGLGVIVLIGVLLSEYLGGPGGTGSGSTASVNRMAPLPIAQTYREQQLKPIGIPGMARAENTEVAMAPAAEPAAPAPATLSTPVTPAAPLMNQMGNLPRAMASDAPATPNTPSSDLDPTPMPTTPVVGPAITPIKDGQVLAHVPANGNLPSGVPMFQLEDTTPVSLNSGNGATASATKPAATPAGSQEYVIAQGDTLMKIAKKFYNSSKPEDCQKIIAANSSYLKNKTTMLVVGKKLIIPNVPQQVATALRPSDTTLSAVAQAKPTTAVMIRTPGTRSDAADARTIDPRKLTSKPETVLAKKESPREYVVQNGDTPEKIARKFGGSLEYARQLMAANKIKDAHNLQIGMKLKLPAK
jgi:LysM repeat protein